MSKISEFYADFTSNGILQKKFPAKKLDPNTVIFGDFGCFRKKAFPGFFLLGFS
jgi:hypothetical protein